MIYPNGRYIKSSPARLFGPAAGLELRLMGGDRYNPFIGSFRSVSSAPDGYGMTTWRPPIKAGSLSAKATGRGQMPGELILALDAVATLLGTGGINAFGSLIVNLTATISGQGGITDAQLQALLELAATITGQGGISGTASGLGALEGVIDGSGGITSTASGIGQLAAIIRGYGELTPEGIRDAIWDAVATEYDTSGTMGAKLNAAGAAGDPWAAIVEGGMTAGDILRVVLSALAGKREGVGTAVESYYGQDGTTIRIEFAHDANNNGTPFIDGAS